MICAEGMKVAPRFKIWPTGFMQEFDVLSVLIGTSADKSRSSLDAFNASANGESAVIV